MTEADVKFRVYRNHDRELLFSGTIESARAAGIRCRLDSDVPTVTVGGVERRIVNRVVRAGDIGFWVS